MAIDPRRILIVDNDAGARHQFRMHVNRRVKQPVEILESNSLSTGLTLANSKKPECVIVDLDGTKGLDFLDQLQHLDEPPPSIILLTDDDENVATEALERGATESLIKNDSALTELLELVNDSLEVEPPPIKPTVRFRAKDDINFSGYETDSFYDELFVDKGIPRREARTLIEMIESLPTGELLQRQSTIEQMLLQMGITFNVYSEGEGTERIWPFDIIPRIIAAREWLQIENGLKQRIQALNMFIHDVYHGCEIIKDGVVPAELIARADSFRQVCRGIEPPRGIWCHITGTDLVRGMDGEIYVLEDNLRCPSGVSYVLKNRELMRRSFPQLFNASSV